VEQKPDAAIIAGNRCLVRAYTLEDAAGLPPIADDFAVARWMTRRFPHPYTAEDARAWVERASTESPVDSFAVVVDGTLVGGVGIRPHDGEAEGVAQFGYWLGRAHWGRGIATEAARLLIAHAFGLRHLRRLEAFVFAPNAASARVLEKCGFTLEGVLRRALTDREGEIVDAHSYALLR
jgi:ribosomal-protein-alanine N-acetyltransferase